MRVLSDLLGDGSKIKASEILVNPHLLLDEATILDRGSNANGHWVRFADGTQYCYGKVNDLNETTSSPAANIYRNPSNVRRDFPITFVERPVVDISLEEMIIVWFGKSSSLTGYSFRAYSPHNNQNIKNAYYSAIGRWK